MNGMRLTRDPRVVRLVAIALGCWAGALLVLRFGWLATRLASGCGVALTSAAIAARRLRSGRWLLALRWGAWTLAGVGVCALTGGHVLARLRDGPLGSLARARASVVVTATVSHDPVALISGGGNLTLIDLQAVGVRVGGHQSRASAPLLGFGYGSAWRSLVPGQRVRFDGRLQPPRAHDLVAAVVDARGPPSLIGRPPWWQRLAERIRLRLAAACAGLPAAERSLVPALVLGVVSPLPPGLREQFRVTGLTHLIAVSGENLAILFAATLGLLRRLGARWWLRALVLLVTVLVFVVVARPTPSVLRAAAMGVVAVVGMLSGRRPDPLGLLALAVAALLVADPTLAVAIGFALSVAATAGLILLARPIARRLERWLPRRVAIAVAAPAAAQLACTPLLVTTFHQLTPWAVPANLVAGIAVAPATVLGVAVAVLAAASTAVAQLLAWVAAAPAAWVVWTARVFAGLPGSTATAGWPVAAAITAALGIGLLLLALRRGRPPPTERDSRSEVHEMLAVWPPPG